MMFKKDQYYEPKDIRIGATAMIWGLSLGMMGIAIPLTAITGSLMIPLGVLLTTCVSTVAVWVFGHHTAAPSDEIKQLKERIANLETIASIDTNKFGALR
jgi:flagellar basal body-associated protein FliL